MSTQKHTCKPSDRAEEVKTTCLFAEKAKQGCMHIWELRPPDHVDHVPSSSAELQPRRPPDHVAMMIAVKNGATTTATIVVTTSRKARGPDNFIAIDQISIQR